MSNLYSVTTIGPNALHEEIMDESKLEKFARNFETSILDLLAGYEPPFVVRKLSKTEVIQKQLDEMFS